MSIRDHKDRELVTLRGVWSALFKTALATLPGLMAGFTWFAWWVITQIFTLQAQQAQQALLAQRLDLLRHLPPP